jgi:hypothetical protein
VAEVESFLFTGTAGQLQTLAAGTIKVLLLSTNAVDNLDPLLTDVTQLDGDEISGGAYGRQTLTGTEWDTDGTWPGLKADNTTFTGLDVTEPDTVGAVVAYHDATGALVGGIRWTPVPVTGDLPIQWRNGYIVTLVLGGDLPDATPADAGLVLTVDTDGNYVLGEAAGGSGSVNWAGEWDDATTYSTGDLVTTTGVAAGLFVATDASTNQPPADTPSVWDLLVQTSAGAWTTYIDGTPTGMPGWVALVDLGGPPGPRTRRLADGRIECSGLAMYIDSGGTPAEVPPDTVLCTIDPEHVPSEQTAFTAIGVDVYGGGAPLGFAQVAFTQDGDDLNIVVMSVPTGSTGIVISPTTWDTL